MRQLIVTIADPYFAWAGLLFFSAAFVGVLVWVFLLKSNDEMKKHARLPLEDYHE